MNEWKNCLSFILQHRVEPGGWNERFIKLSSTTNFQWMKRVVLTMQEPLSRLFIQNLHFSLRFRRWSPLFLCIRGFGDDWESCFAQNLINMNCAVSRSRPATHNWQRQLKLNVFRFFLHTHFCHLTTNSSSRTCKFAPESELLTIPLRRCTCEMLVRHHGVGLFALHQMHRCQRNSQTRASSAINFKWQIYEKWIRTCASPLMLNFWFSASLVFVMRRLLNVIWL